MSQNAFVGSKHPYYFENIIFKQVVKFLKIMKYVITV